MIYCETLIILKNYDFVRVFFFLNLSNNLEVSYSKRKLKIGNFTPGLQAKDSFRQKFAIIKL